MGSSSFQEEITVNKGLRFIHQFGISSKYIRYFKPINFRQPKQNMLMKQQSSHLPPTYSNLLASSPLTTKGSMFKKKKSSENC